MRLEVLRGDITSLDVDAVVNAAGPAMRGGGGVDGAIHRAAGPTLLRECVTRFPEGLPVGAAGWTTAGGMPARWVIHVVGPNRHAGQTDPELLASCYRNALAVADELGVQTLASPLVGAGAYGWPLASAADIAVRTLRATPTAVESCALVAFSDDALAAITEALCRSAG